MYGLWSSYRTSDNAVWLDQHAWTSRSWETRCFLSIHYQVGLWTFFVRHWEVWIYSLPRRQNGPWTFRFASPQGVWTSFLPATGTEQFPLSARKRDDWTFYFGWVTLLFCSCECRRQYYCFLNPSHPSYAQACNVEVALIFLIAKLYLVFLVGPPR